MQVQFQNAEGLIVAHLRTRWSAVERVERGEVCPARTHHELANTPLRVRSAGTIERLVTLVIMIMTGQQHLHPMVIERLPQRLQQRGVMELAEAIARMVQ